MNDFIFLKIFNYSIIHYFVPLNLNIFIINFISKFNCLLTTHHWKYHFFNFTLNLLLQNQNYVSY